jgi:hypothetical protein
MQDHLARAFGDLAPDLFKPHVPEFDTPAEVDSRQG